MARPPSKPAQPVQPTHVALIRGINVGGKHLLPMAELSRFFLEAGCSGVQTYIQSGNVVFASPASLAGRLPCLISERVKDKFGFQPAIMIRTADDIAHVASSNPFLAQGVDVKALYVAFLDSQPSAASIARIDPKRSPHDRFSVQGSHVFFHYTKGVLESKLTNTYIDAALGTSSTFRNWNTVTKLAQMLAGPSTPPARPTPRRKARP